MKKTYKINNFDNHLIIEDNGNTLLIDTGSPFSILDKSLDFCGQRFEPGWIHFNALDISNLIGTKIDALVGYNILKHFNLLIDYQEGSITFSDENTELPGATTIPFTAGFGVPRITVNLLGESKSCFLDSGAKISYIHSKTTQGLTPEGTDSDFYLGFGHFDTPIFPIETSMGDQSLTVRYGNLPPVLEVSLLTLLNADGIVGFDFFNNFKVLIDYKNNMLSFKKRS